VLEGRKQREEERIHLIAWQVATMINLWSSEKVTPHQLITGESEAITDIDEEFLADELAEEAEDAARAEQWHASLERPLIPDGEE
jgi:hypothetical protein